MHARVEVDAAAPKLGECGQTPGAPCVHAVAPACRSMHGGEKRVPASKAGIVVDTWKAPGCSKGGADPLAAGEQASSNIRPAHCDLHWASIVRICSGTALHLIQGSCRAFLV